MKPEIGVLIVEDEPAVARGIQILIDRFPGAFTILGVVYNGQDGMEAIREEKPDLVFTDIRMPLMTGLEMIEETKKSGLETHFVILSGYAEFEYAKKALQLSVSHYLLKPVVPAELYDLLTEFESSFAKALRVSQKEYITGMLMNPEEAPLQNPFTAYSCHLLFCYYGPVVTAFYEDFSIGRETVLHADDHLIPEIEKKYHVHIFSVKGGHCNEVIYVITFPSDAEIPFDALVAELWERMKSAETYTNIIVSRRIREGKNISKTIENCKLFTLFHLPFGKSKVQYYHNFAATRNLETSGYISDECERYAGYSNFSLITNMILNFTKFWEREEITQLQLQMDLRYCLNYFVSLSETGQQYSINVDEMIASCNSFCDLNNKLLSEVKVILKIRDEGSSPSDSKQMIYQVKDFLEKNFTQPLSYKVFNDKFGYHEKYISALYKLEFGITPGKYISELRIEFAKKIMNENPEILLKDVAIRTGYQDALYFSRVFKSKEGMSPSRYLQDILSQAELRMIYQSENR